MLLVPLKDDKIETKDGITYVVLSYTNYRDKGPAVYVEHTPSVPSDAVYFFDIAKINGITVEYVTGSKVFRSLGKVKRKFQLPQPADSISFRGPNGVVEQQVVGLKLHKKGELAKGLQVQVKDDTGETSLVRISQIIDIRRDIGNDVFSRDKFLSYYVDYQGSR